MFAPSLRIKSITAAARPRDVRCFHRVGQDYFAERRLVAMIAMSRAMFSVER